MRNEQRISRKPTHFLFPLSVEKTKMLQTAINKLFTCQSYENEHMPFSKYIIQEVEEM